MEIHDPSAERDALRTENHGLKQELDSVRAELKSAADRLAELNNALRFPPGHFYSAIPAIQELEAHKDEIFKLASAIPDVDLHEKQQLELLDQFRPWYGSQPFTPDKTPGRRYFFENPNFSYADAITLYSMMRHLRPRRIVEVGSGYSSCAILDTNELFFGGRIKCTFVEPYPGLVRELVQGASQDQVRILDQRVQDADMGLFEELGPGDILFIDSSHVSKTGSDVNYLIFKILPMLKEGVHIHFHDVFYPFEYPPHWALEGRAWNEIYILHAFLAYNRAFRVRFFPTYLMHRHHERFEDQFPLFLKNTGGSLWLQRISA